jgi:hypothetical protein
LPRLQELAGQYKDSQDVVFLSFNIDENPGLISRFLAEQKLTLLVLPAYSYATGTLKIEVIPQNWILGPDANIRLKALGSYNSPEKWAQAMKDAIEKIRTAGPR